MVHDPENIDHPATAGGASPLLVCLTLAALGCGGDKLDSADPCPGWAEPVAVNTVAFDGLDEASGLTSSLLHPGLMWTHNDDSDGDGQVFALSTGATIEGTFTLGGSEPEDWEAIAATGYRGESELIVGDIGDNDAVRDDITLFITPEPTVIEAEMTAPIVTRASFSLPDGPTDIEAMLVDPATGAVLLFTRNADRTDVYAVASLDDRDATPTLAASIDLNTAPYDGLGAVRAADVAADGSVVLRLSDGVVWLQGNGSAIDALDSDACVVPSPPETDGEGVAIIGSDLYFIGEGASPTLWFVQRSSG